MTTPFIRRLEHFTPFSPEERAALADFGSGRRRRFEPGDDLIPEGGRPQVVNLVSEGWACRYKQLDDGRRQISALFLPGDLCDLDAMVVEEMDHSIGAITSLTVIEIDPEALARLLANQRLARALWWNAMVSASVQREWTVSLGQRKAVERVSHLLCEIFARLEAAGLTLGRSCDFPLTQTELGEATGLSTVHVNRTLQQLRSSGLVVLRGRTLTLPDRPALEALAGFSPNYLHLRRDGAETIAAPTGASERRRSDRGLSGPLSARPRHPLGA